MMNRAQVRQWLSVGLCAVALSAACAPSGVAPTPEAPTSRTADEEYLDAVRPIFGPRTAVPSPDDMDDPALLKLRETMCRRIRTHPERWDSMSMTMADIWRISPAESAKGLRIIVLSGCPALIKHDPEPAI